MYFPEDMLMELKSKAKQDHTTVSDIVRKAIKELFRGDKVEEWDKDPLWDMVGKSRSDEGDLSIHHDQYLYGEKK
ncbi:MAG TPA: hypothetical protein DCG53_02690 [Syntrophus sp. (in: bacteria)]|jgi:hypothetical protein|nr:hypothetical protein [Syntrophus sp. (in: bacteria)]